MCARERVFARAGGCVLVCEDNISEDISVQVKGMSSGTNEGKK